MKVNEHILLFLPDEKGGENTFQKEGACIPTRLYLAYVDIPSMHGEPRSERVRPTRLCVILFRLSPSLSQRLRSNVSNSRTRQEWGRRKKGPLFIISLLSARKARYGMRSLDCVILYHFPFLQESRKLQSQLGTRFFSCSSFDYPCWKEYVNGARKKIVDKL